MGKMIVFLLVSALLSVGLANEKCRTFRLSTEVAEYTISFASVCIPGEDSILKMTVATEGKKVSVDSVTLSSPDVDVRQAISKKIMGLSPGDAKIIVDQIGPALKIGDYTEAKLFLIDLILND